MDEIAPGIERDPVIEAYKAGLDHTLDLENLKLTVEEPFVKAMELQRFAEELRRAGKEQRDELRRDTKGTQSPKGRLHSRRRRSGNSAWRLSTDPRG